MTEMDAKRKEIQDRIEKLKDGALKEITKKHGTGSIILGEGEIKPVDIVCSTGSIGLDNAIGIGGYPKGRIIELSGWESSGKSTLTLINIAEIQRNGGVCAYIDAEQAFDPIYAEKIGVDVDNLIISQPECIEEAIDILRSLIKSGLVSYIVYDSTNFTLSRKLIEGEVGDADMGRGALIFSTELPKIAVDCSKSGCTVVFISQIRSKIGVSFGSPEVVGKGNAMRFAASIRMKVSKSDSVKTDEEGQESIDITVSIFKNKVATPYKKATFTLLTGKDGQYGVDVFKEILQFAIQYELISKAGAWYKIMYKGNEERFQGEANIVAWLKSNPEAYEEIKSQVVVKLKEKNDGINKPVEGSFDAIQEQKEEKKRRKRGEEPIAVEVAE